MLSDLQLAWASFDLWIHADGEDNLVEIERAKRMLPIVLDECVTNTQKKYILDYYINKMSTTEIAELYGVNKSTVSRTIHRGIDNAYKYLRFVSPLFIKRPRRREALNNGKGRPSKAQEIGDDNKVDSGSCRDGGFEDLGDEDKGGLPYAWPQEKELAI